MKWKNVHVFLILCTSFLIYSFSIYLQPLSAKKAEGFDVKKASEGHLVWQKYNCQTCHQLYGLGGFLGPDLTNVISTQGKGEPLIRAMVSAGAKQMPAFNLSEEELSNLIEFLKSVDKSGTSDPRSFKTERFGMIEQNEKK
ncbi:MAG: cytochrome c [Bacteroidia bacterium]